MLHNILCCSSCFCGFGSWHRNKTASTCHRISYCIIFSSSTEQDSKQVIWLQKTQWVFDLWNFFIESCAYYLYSDMGFLFSGNLFQVYPKVKVRTDGQDDQPPHSWGSLLSLKDVQFLCLQDSCSPGTSRPLSFLKQPLFSFFILNFVAIFYILLPYE